MPQLNRSSKVIGGVVSEQKTTYTHILSKLHFLFVLKHFKRIDINKKDRLNQQFGDIVIIKIFITMQTTII